MRLRLLYDSTHQVDPGALLAQLSNQGIEQELFDIRFLDEITSLCGTLAEEAVNVIDPSVSASKSCLLLGYALGTGMPVIHIRHQTAASAGPPVVDKLAVNVATATPDSLQAVLARLLADMERQQLVPENQVGLFTRIEPGEAVSIVCAEIPASLRPEYGQPSHRDFLRYATFADVDALIQLMVWFAAAKHRAVHAYTSQQLPEDAIGSHLLVVGGPAWNTLARSLYREIDLPVEHRDGGPGNPDPIIERATGETWLPEILPEGGVVSDVGLVAQVRSPYHPERSVTIFGGILTHGVEAGVKVFTSPAVRTQNWDLVRSLQESPGEGFCVVFRSRVFANNNVPPDLSESGVLLAAYSQVGGGFTRVRATQLRCSYSCV